MKRKMAAVFAFLMLTGTASCSGKTETGSAVNTAPVISAADQICATL